MMDRSPKPPEALMRAIAQDLRPVKPSPQPLQLALRMVPLALLVSSVILLAIGPRHDLGILGPLLGWGASAAQFVLAIVLVWIAAHESTPAGRLSATVSSDEYGLHRRANLPLTISRLHRLPPSPEPNISGRPRIARPNT